MLWVTISVVRRSSPTSRLVSSSTNSAVRGSSAAVCSSSSRILEGAMVAIKSATACRCPPESRPIRSPRRFSRPSPSSASRPRQRSRPGEATANASPRPRPRASASARFSSIVSPAQVPASGSWNTRASSRARSAACSLVTSAPSTAIRPSVAGAVPASTLSSVDLPALLLPMTVTNCPSGIARSTPRRARLEHGPAAEHDRDALSSITEPPAPPSPMSLARVAGRISAAPTSSAVTRFRSDACSPRKSASRASATATR